MITPACNLGGHKSCEKHYEGRTCACDCHLMDARDMPQEWWSGLTNAERGRIWIENREADQGNPNAVVPN